MCAASDIGAEGAVQQAGLCAVAANPVDVDNSGALSEVVISPEEGTYAQKIGCCH